LISSNRDGSSVLHAAHQTVPPSAILRLSGWLPCRHAAFGDPVGLSESADRAPRVDGAGIT
jgi:predicted benzoate:H+ symporter BenE